MKTKIKMNYFDCWVIVSPHGAVYVGFHDDERDAWRVCLGWPDEFEIAEHKRRGWYAAKAKLTWNKHEGTDV